jgi:hypothetical protein
MAKNHREKIPPKTVYDIERLNHDMADEFDDDTSSEQSYKDIYDRKYADSNKRHRNLLSKFNHWFVIVSHPFSLICFFMVILGVFLITRYISLIINGQEDVVSKISADAETALSYLGTIIITSVFTKFLEQKKK